MNNTLLKGLAVLELLSRSATPLSLSQISTQLNMVKSNVHRLMQALVETRYVFRHEGSGAYSPSIKLWELGSAVLSKLDIRRFAENHMEALLEVTGESVHLSVLDGNEVVYVHKLESTNPVRAYTQIGGRVPAHCVATGKVQLAFCSPGFLAPLSRKLTSHTSRTIFEPEPFLKELAKIRTNGYAINRGEWRESVWGIAAPIKDARGTVIAALGISGPADRFRRSLMSSWTQSVCEAASKVSESLGGYLPQSELGRIRFGAI